MSLLFISSLAASVPEEFCSYTQTTEVCCIDDICTQRVGWLFLDEDGWKPDFQVKSLKGRKGYDVVYLEDDGDHVIVVTDFNYTHIDFDLSFVGNPADYEYEEEIEDGKTKIKMKFKVGIGDMVNEYEIETEDGSTKISFDVDNVFAYTYAFGEYSTLIQLTTPDTENLQDSFVAEGSATRSEGSSVNLRIVPLITGVMRIYMMWNITSPDIIPAGQIVEAADLYLWMYADNAGGTYDVDAHHVYNHSWEEGATGFPRSWPDLIWNNQPCGVSENPLEDIGTCNVTAAGTTSVDPTTSVWRGWDVLDAVKRDYDDGETNVSIMLKVNTESTGDNYQKDFYSKEGTTKPYLNITYSPAPIIYVESETLLFLNDTQANRTYEVGEYANFTVVTNITGGLIYMDSDYTGWEVQSGTTSYENSTYLITIGTDFNITGYYAGNGTVNPTNQTYYFNVTIPTVPTVAAADFGVWIRFITNGFKTILVR